MTDNKHSDDVSSGAGLEFECDECERKFTKKNREEAFTRQSHTHQQQQKTIKRKC